MKKLKDLADRLKKAEEVNDWIIWVMLAIISLSGIIYLVLEVIK